MNTMTCTDDSSSILAKKLAHATAELKPFQSLAYEPETDTVLIMTELCVSSEAVDQVTEILTRRSRRRAGAGQTLR